MNLTEANKLEQDMYYLRSHIHDMRSPLSSLKMIASYE